MRIPYKLYTKPFFWKFKSKAIALRFTIRKAFFLIKRRYNSEKTKAHSLSSSFKSTIISAIRAILFILFLFYVEHLLNDYWDKNWHSFPLWLVRFNNLFIGSAYPREAIIEFVSVIASVSGVMLALFYPVIATIISTAYSKVHASIKSLVLREKSTQNYLRQLTFLTASAITVLLFMSFGFYPRGVILTFLIFYSLIMLFTILKIGMGAFTLLEPSTLGIIIKDDLIELIDNVTTRGEYWSDASFQSHYYRNAQEKTQNLILITNMCSKDNEINESSIVTNININFSILRYYLRNKLRIPITSLWYPQIYNHPSFFESDMTSRTLSKNTSTFTQPKKIQNFHWLEEQIIQAISIGLDVAIKKRPDIAYEVIKASHTTLILLTYKIDIKTAEAILSNQYKSVEKLSDKKKKAEKIRNYDEWKNELQCLEAFITSFFHFQTGTLKRMTEFTAGKLSTEYSKIDWRKDESIYETDFLPELYETLTKFKVFLNNEVLIENTRITPDSYLIQSIANQHLRFISEKLPKTVSLIHKYIISLAKHYSRENNPLLASYLSHLGLELIHKLEFRIGELEKSVNSIDTLELWKKEFPWTKPDIQKIKKELNGYIQEFLDIIATNISKLSSIEWNNQYPDVFAQSYSVLSSNINLSFLNNDLDKYSKLFAPYLQASIDAFNNLNKIFKDYTMPWHISHQPLINVMHISSYAYIYAAIYEEPKYWEITKDFWDKIFEPSKDNIELLIQNYNYYDTNLLRTGIGYSEIHERFLTLGEVVEKRGLTPKSFSDKLVSSYIPDSFFHSHYDLAELFIEIYLMTFIQSKKAASLMNDRKLFKHIYSKV